ncbi:MAG: hypothetical protein Q8P42_03825 [Gallionella sp.]|nr:hypothetical protein [Gallionella sp.]
MADYAAKLKELLRANQCRFERQGGAIMKSGTARSRKFASL